MESDGTWWEKAEPAFYASKKQNSLSLKCVTKKSDGRAKSQPEEASKNIRCNLAQVAALKYMLLLPSGNTIC